MKWFGFAGVYDPVGEWAKLLIFGEKRKSIYRE